MTAPQSDPAIVQATPAHGDAMLALLPQLAAFDIPARREPEHLWHGDRDLVQEWLAGQRPECFALAAVDTANDLAGFAFVTMREELLSHAPSAHLEIIAVAPHARRSGLGQRLCDATEREARSRGAGSITLHVFAANQRARALYAKQGYDEELIRCIKDL